MRLDVYLFESKLAKSRTDGKALIQSGAVLVNGRVIKKTAYDVCADDEIKVLIEGPRYVSRGGLKLECAIRSFDFTIEGKSAMDVGASTGGFTDCLLQHGAKAVVAIDSGTNQLAECLRCDGRVFVMENCNARYLSREQLPFIPELAVMDVSFISATYVIPAIYGALADDGDFICLVKPQFEVGRGNLGKGGIVKDDKLRRAALDKVCDFARNVGFKVISFVRSDVVGGDGNIEFLVHFRKQREDKNE